MVLWVWDKEPSGWLTGPRGEMQQTNRKQEGGAFLPDSCWEVFVPTGNHFSYSCDSALLPLPENLPSSKDQDGRSDFASFGIYTGTNHFFLVPKLS